MRRSTPSPPPSEVIPDGEDEEQAPARAEETREEKAGQGQAEGSGVNPWTRPAPATPALTPTQRLVMFGKGLKRIKAGTVLTARTINRAIDEISRQTKITASAPLMIQDLPNGQAIVDTSERPFWIKLTSGSGAGPYAWTKQVSTSPGVWVDAVQVGTTSIDPAYNSAGSATPTLPIIVPVQRASDGTLYFQIAGC